MSNISPSARNVKANSGSERATRKKAGRSLRAVPETANISWSRVADYTYEDVGDAGELVPVFTKFREEAVVGGKKRKKFSVYRVEATRPKLKRVSGLLDDTPRPPYRYREILAAEQSGEDYLIVLVDGEKDADRGNYEAAATGDKLVFTCAHDGDKEFAPYFRDCIAETELPILIIPDKDPSGLGYCEALGKAKQFGDQVIGVVEGRGEKDLSDHFDAGYSWDDFVEVKRALLELKSGRYESAKMIRSMTDLTQFTFAEILVVRHGAELRYVPSPGGKGTWLNYEWSSGYWRRDNHEYAEWCAKQLHQEIRDYVEERHNALKAKGKSGIPKKRAAVRAKCTDASYRGTLAAARVERPIQSSWSQFDRDTHLFNVPSGTWDLRTKELREHDPADMITKITPVDPCDEGPNFEAFFRRVQPDAEKRTRIFRNTGSCLDGTPGERALIHSGEGANGKTTFLSACVDALGPHYAKTGNWRLLHKAGEEAHDTYGKLLVEKRLVVVQMGTRTMSPEQLKTYVAERSINVRGMHENSTDFAATHTLAVAQNDPPPLSKVDAATRRRVHNTSWDVTIPEDERDSRLPDTFELGYVLKQLIDGYFESKAARVDPEDTEQYLRNNEYYAFVSDCLEVDPTPGQYVKFDDIAAEFTRRTGKKHAPRSLTEALDAAHYAKGRTRATPGSRELSTVRYNCRIKEGSGAT